MHARMTISLLTATVLLAGCSGSASPRADPTTATTPAATPTTAAPATAPSTGAAVAPTPSAAPAAVVPRVLTSGLQVLWGLAFLPDGSALVGERDTARIHQVFPDGRRKQVATVPGVQPGGEGGLLGLAVSRTYTGDRWVYAYYTASADNRIVRFRLTAPAKLQVLLSGIPKAGNHNGGRLAFGPDGMLYAGTGDAGDPGRAQDTGSLGGKILRIKPTGGAATGNPFRSPVWTVGHRNVQGLAFDAEGRLWASEFGQNTFDEVNLISRGGNYGWPLIEGRGTGGGKYTSPQVVWATSEASPSGVAFAGGALHVAALRGERLWDVPLSGATASPPAARYRGTYGRLRSVALEPGGAALWVTTSNCDGRGDCGSRQDLVVRVPV